MAWTKPSIEIEACEVRYTDPPRSGQTQTGYGVAVPSGRMIRRPGEKVWRRVYVTIFSNAGTAWVRIKGRKHIVN